MGARVQEQFKKYLTFLPYVVLLAALVIQYVLIVDATDGHFVYGMDDPYIHLALAENIARGHYGVNLEEYSAPASSILWPFLLVPFAASAVFLYVPLFLNALFAGLALLAVQKSIRLILGETYYTRSPGLVALSLCCLIFGFNLIGLTYLGMEHMMQVWVSLQLLYGLLIITEKERCPKWLPWIILLGPLVRYENLALSGVAILFLWYRGFWKQAILPAIIILLSTGGFSGFLMHIGLSPLPSSTLVKLQYQTQAPSMWLQKLTHPNHIIILLLAITLLVTAWKRRTVKHEIAWLIALAGFTHVAFAAVAAGDRYEAYITAVLMMTVLYYHKAQVKEVFDAHPEMAALRITVALGGVLVMYVIASTYNVPLRSESIYRQQFQMQRFIKEFAPSPVAVNDIGLVSLQNDHYVLDLVGLANEEGRHHLFTSPEERRKWINEASQAHGVKYAAIYADWFEGVLPETWKPVAQMKSMHARDVGDDTVTFYAIAPQYTDALKKSLKAFGKTLPDSVKLIWLQ